MTVSRRCRWKNVILPAVTLNSHWKSGFLTFYLDKWRSLHSLVAVFFFVTALWNEMQITQMHFVRQRLWIMVLCELVGLHKYHVKRAMLVLLWSSFFFLLKHSMDNRWITRRRFKNKIFRCENYRQINRLSFMPVSLLIILSNLSFSIRQKLKGTIFPLGIRYTIVKSNSTNLSK